MNSDGSKLPFVQVVIEMLASLNLHFPVYFSLILVLQM